MTAGATYTPIQSVTLTTAVATVTFGSGGTLPQTYTDLVLVCNPKGSAGGNGIIFNLNGDFGSNYSDTILRADGSTASSARQSNNSCGNISNLSGLPTASFGTYETHFMNYFNTSTFKNVFSRGSNADSGGGVDIIGNLWRSTSAITSILVSTTGGNFTIGSQFTLYGIAAA